jgi:hypothetical protein
MPTTFIPRVVQESSAAAHYYADGTSGNDANDGRTISTPKKTLQAVFALLPQTISANISVHLKGTFVDPGNINIFNTVNGYLFIIDGGSELTVLEGPYTIDTLPPMGPKEQQSFGNTGLSWTPGALEGLWAEVSADDFVTTDLRLISVNSATIIEPSYGGIWSLGNKFRIVKPKTTISQSGSNYLGIVSSGNGGVVIQRLLFAGANNRIITNNQANITISQVMMEGGYLSGQRSCFNAGHGFYDSDTFAYISSGQKVAGLSMLGTSSYVSYSYGYSGMMGASFVRRISITNCKAGNYVVGTGTRIKGSGTNPGIYVRGSEFSLNLLGDYSHRTVQIDGCTRGIHLEGCKNAVIACSYSDMLIKNNSSHAVELNNSKMRVVGGILKGTGNTGAGVYAYNNSIFDYETGQQPTVTGTVGDVSLDGTTQASTWATINGGTPINSTAEMTIVRKN